MVTEEEIRRIARKKELTVGLTEKDYVIEWLLKGIYESDIKNKLIFKGGTAIKKVYFPEVWRFSHDLDFTARDLNIKNTNNYLEKIFKNIEAKSSVKLEFKSFHLTPESIIANVQFLGPLNSKNRIRMDISFNEKIFTEPVLKRRSSPYPDIKNYTVVAYSLDEILAEKIRCIMQRGKSRDYYEVWMLLKTRNFDLRKIKDLLIKNVNLKILSVIQN